MQTLKKEHQQKRQAEKSKVQEREKQKQIKKQLQDLNKNTRAENYNRFRQEKFHPKYPWGTDERRITRVNDPKILKEAEELRKRRREERERSKSAGRGRIGLDVLKLKRDHSKHQEEELPLKKPPKEKNKSILLFMKKQKKDRQKSREIQQERAREEENKRLLQLMELEKLTRLHPKRTKSSKASYKKYGKKDEASIEDSCINFSEDEEVMEILHGVRSATPDSYEIRPQINSFDYKQSGRECMVFGVFPESSSIETKGNITQIVTDIVEKRVKTEESIPKASMTMPLADVKASYSVVNTEEEYRESSSSDISKRKEGIKKKLAELRNRVDQAKSFRSDDYEDKRKQAAIKIQAVVRGVLTRQALRRYFEEIEGHSMQESGDYGWVFEKKYEDDHGESSCFEDYEVQNIVGSSYSHSLGIAKENFRKSEKYSHKKQEVEKILKSQIEWRETQKKKLIMLKNKDLEEMQAIARKVGSEEILMKHFEDIIERRYAHIDQLFDENIEAVKSAVQQAIEEENPESLQHTLEKQENFASEVFQHLHKNEEINEILKLKNDIDFKNIWNYSESSEQSVRISELDLESSSQRTHELTERHSIDFQPENFTFVELPLPSPAIISTFEPTPTVFIADILDTLVSIIGQECYVNLLSEAWEDILTGSQFINEVAEIVMKILISQESDALYNFDFYVLLQKDLISKENTELFAVNSPVPLLQLRPIEPQELIEVKGISMDESYLLQYLNKLFDYLHQVHFNFELAMSTSNTIHPLEMLSKMQEAEIGVMIEKTLSVRILQLQLYLNLEKESVVTTQLQEAQHIHNKLIFDVANELLFCRCRKPQPMPWSLDTKTVSEAPLQIGRILTEVVEEVKEMNRVHAGKVPVIDVVSNSQDTEDDLIQQMREEQLSCMLATEIATQEPLWINYEFEEMQVKLDLADMALETLVEETIDMLKLFSN